MDFVDLHESTWCRIHAGRARMAHAVLLAGPAGIYKNDFSLELAGSFLCESPQSSGRLCGRCSACHWFSQGNHPDFRWLRPESAEELKPSEESPKASKEKQSREITIDQVRALNDFLNVGTHRSGMRIVLITPAEAMNRNTANALLKSLEEPRNSTIFLLVSDHPDRLLPTIRSRCRLEAMSRPEYSKALEYLKGRDVVTPDRWLALAGGAPRLALELASGNQKRLQEILEGHLSLGDRLDPIRLAQEIDTLLRADRQLQVSDVIEWTQRWVHDLVLASFGLSPRYHAHAKAIVCSVAERSKFERLSKLSRRMLDFKKLAHHPLNCRLFFEDFYSEYLVVFR